TDSSMVWSFSTPPLINWVYEGGPAYEAGIRPGDLLLGVDGLNIVTEEGGRRF
ncbi:MAG: hypothetical protein GWN32_15395, partial [Gemmatimonadetes bacterium]|nr:hypothetical protein [Gemmatimonadota bacterium]